MTLIKEIIVFATAFIFCLFSMLLGNYQGDQATMRDCAIKSEARMLGGGTIECTVRKESK